MCVCVYVTQLSYKKNCKFKNVLFLWLETGSFLETGKRLIVLVYECLRGMVLLPRRNFGQREGVAATKKFSQRECCRYEEISSKRKKVLKDNVSIENTVL